MKLILKNEDKSFQQMLDELIKGTTELEKIKKDNNDEEKRLIKKYDNISTELMIWISNKEIDSSSKTKIKKACESYEKIKKQK